MLAVWRKSKKNRSEKIPERIWDQVISLLKTSPGAESKILAACGLTHPQLETEKQRRQSVVSAVDDSSSLSTGTIDFCEAQRKPASTPVTPLAHKPAMAFTTNTSVVEVYRPDGMLMKIHICTDRFEELLSAFFKG
jgi:hypothetical protein